MIGEIICVGNELLMGDTLNTNTKYLSQQLIELGIDIRFQVVVGDDEVDLKEAIVLGSSRSDILIFTGGLGPTYDDMTKETLAKTLDKKLILDKNALEQMTLYFKKRDIPMAETNMKQAYKLDSGITLRNNNGTAPGIYIIDKGTHYILLPGPPQEMKAMYKESVKPILTNLSSEIITSKILRLIGIGESDLEINIGHIMDKSTNPRIAPYASLGSVALRLTARSKTQQESENLIQKTVDNLMPYIKSYCYTDENKSLEEIIIDIMRKRGMTLGVAESCTGGLLSSRIIDVAGVSDVYQAGFITYSNKAKEKYLNISNELIETEGAVSEKVAISMAKGVRATLKTSIGIGITGIAGPNGGTKEKPVGTVYISIASENDTLAKKYHFIGNRDKIRRYSVQYALTDLYRYLESDKGNIT